MERLRAWKSILVRYGGHDSPDPTPEQVRLKEIYEDLRSEILDKGNTQIRNSEAEIENYDVTWNKYHYNIPVQRNL